jgi:hypothetical protein
MPWKAKANSFVALCSGLLSMVAVNVTVNRGNVIGLEVPILPIFALPFGLTCSCADFGTVQLPTKRTLPGRSIAESSRTLAWK